MVSTRSQIFGYLIASHQGLKVGKGADHFGAGIGGIKGLFKVAHSRVIFDSEVLIMSATVPISVRRQSTIKHPMSELPFKLLWSASFFSLFENFKISRQPANVTPSKIV